MAVAQMPDALTCWVAQGAALRLWDLESGQRLRELSDTPDRVLAVAATPDGRLLCAGGNDGSLRTWDLPQGEPRRLDGHRGYVRCVVLTADGRLALSGGDDGSVRLWDLAAGTCVRTARAHAAEVRAVRMTPDGRRAISAGRDAALRVWDLAGGSRSARGEHAHDVWRLDGTADGRIAVTADAQYSFNTPGGAAVRVWDVETGSCLRVLQGHVAGIASVAIGPDGRFAVSCGDQNHYDVRVWDLASGLCLNCIECHAPARSVVVTGDGRRAVIAPDPHDLRCIDLATGECLMKMEGHFDEVADLALSPDGRLLASAGAGLDCTVRLWDLSSGRRLHLLGDEPGLDADRERRKGIGSMNGVSPVGSG